MDWSPLFLSIRVAVSATVLVFLLAVPVAWWVHSRSRVPVLWDSLFSIPMVLPPTVVGFLLLISFGNYSPIGRFLRTIGIPLVFTWYGAVVASSIVAFPLFYRTVRTALQQVNYATLACAKTLGISNQRIFFQLLLPEISPALFSGMVLSFCRALGEFGATSLLAGNIPKVTQTMSLAIYTAVNTNDLTSAYLWSGFLIAFSFALMGMSEWMLRKYRKREQRRYEVF